MNIKTNWVIGIVVVLAIVGSVILYGHSASDSNDVVTIGAVLPLTGGAAYWGEPSSRGALLAADEIQRRYGSDDFQLIIEDSLSNPTDGVNAARKLIDIHSVDALYSELTTISNAVSPIAAANNTVMLYNAFTPEILEDNAQALKWFINYEAACEDFATHARQEGIGRVAVIDEGGALSPTCTKGLRSNYAPGDIVVKDLVPEDDYRTILLKMEDQGVGAIVMLTFENTGLKIIRQKNELDMDTPLYCYRYNCVTDKIVDTLGLAGLEGSVYFEVGISDEFVRRYEEKYGVITEADLQPAAFSHDAVLALYSGLRECRNDSAECIAAHANEVDFPKALSDAVFEDRALVIGTNFSMVRDGQTVSIDID